MVLYDLYEYVSPIAQWFCMLTCIPEVGGSNPATSYLQRTWPSTLEEYRFKNASSILQVSLQQAPSRTYFQRTWPSTYFAKTPSSILDVSFLSILKSYLNQVYFKYTWLKYDSSTYTQYVLVQVRPKYILWLIPSILEVYLKYTWIGPENILRGGGQISKLEVYFLDLSTRNWHTSSILEVYLK